jgi:hypothetical protein
VVANTSVSESASTPATEFHDHEPIPPQCQTSQQFANTSNIFQIASGFWHAACNQHVRQRFSKPLRKVRDGR